MASLSEYLNWRGDITFEQVPLTTIDALLLSHLSYLNLAGIVDRPQRNKEWTLAQTEKRYWELHTEEEFEKCVSFAVRTEAISRRRIFPQSFSAR